MTRTRYRFCDTGYPHFVTCTINSWLPVFTNQESVDIIFDSWRYLKQNREFELYSYVILENHIHFVAKSPNLSNDVKSFKSFTARQIIELLKSRKVQTLLRQLEATKLKHKSESTYQVWQEGSMPKQIQNDEMMEQKIDYIHMNPVKRGFVSEPEHWRWSSASSYAGKNGLIDVRTDWWK